MTIPVTIDVPRLRKELEYITAHRVQWKQSTWLQRSACGTVGCLAGNTVINAGYVPIFVGNDVTASMVSNRRLTSRDEISEAVYAGEAVSIRVLATKLLGLTTEQADTLFSAVNSLYDLWEIASQFTNGEIEIPPEVEREQRRFPLPDGEDLIALDREAAHTLHCARERGRRNTGSDVR